MRLSPTRSETTLLAACAVLLLAALLGPHLAQPGHAHAFADQRTLWGIPCALDVLSNLPFAIAGLLGFAGLRHAALPRVQRHCAQVFFAGLLLTAAGSSFYHWAPDDLGLAIDRTTMSVAFAGLLGLLAEGLAGERAGRATLLALLAAAPLAVATWFFTGNVLPWALVQFGGVPVLLLAAFVEPQTGALQVRWTWVLLAYAVAKLFEINDHAVYAATSELLSGHTLKHVVAALAAWPVIAAVAAAARGQNEPAAATAPMLAAHQRSKAV